jgi:LysR family hydrogen peroxide-inducible transcriptional activator
MKDLILLSQGNCMRDQILELCQARRNTPAHYYFESGSLDTLMRIVDCTACMTIIPEMALEYIPAARKSQIKTLAKGATSRRIAIAVRRTYVKNSIINALESTILEKMQMELAAR